MIIKQVRYAVFILLLLSSLIAGCQYLPELPSQGGVLKLYGGVGPQTLDPAISGDATSHGYITQLFSGLVRLDDKLEPAPDIAQKWEISPDGKTYTFHLKKDVKFHNGREVKAQDFKYSWERASDPATRSLTADTYLGDIVGVKEVLAGRSKEIAGVKIVDDYTLQVTIDSPKSYFLSKIAYPTSFVIDRENVKTGDWWRRPNGTGSFKLKRWDENQAIVLERNASYYGESAKLDSVAFSILGGAPMNMYETGEIDATDVSLAYIDRVTDKAGSFYRELTVAPELSFFFIGFNASKPPFDDVNIRRAFSQAIDKEKVVSLVFRGMVQAADGILPPGIPGYNKDLKGLEYDVNRAKELIKQSRYGDVSKLPPITITTSGWGGLISSGLEAIIHQWRENLGVEVKVRQLEPQRFFYNLKEEKDEMFDMGWIADYPHPQDFLEILFSSSSNINYGDYSNAEVDSLLERAGVEQDREKSLALYREAEQKLVEDAASLPLWFGRNYVLVKSYVRGYQVNPLGYVTLNKVSIQPR